MKLTDRNCSILKYLRWDKNLFRHPDLIRPNKRAHAAGFQNFNEDVGDPEMFRAMKELFEGWGRLGPEFRKEVAVLSKNFARQMESVQGKFHEETIESFVKGKTFSGTILAPFAKTAYCYRVSFSPSNRSFDDFTFFVLSDYDTITAYMTPSMTWVSKQANTANIDGVKDVPTNRQDYVTSVAEMVILYILFSHFAPVTEKEVRKGKTISLDHPDDTHDSTLTNDTFLPVKYRDVTWFTTYRSTEGFPRRGFLRWQRVKIDGEWTHRLTPVKATWVKGYTRHAGILNSSGTQDNI